MVLRIQLISSRNLLTMIKVINERIIKTEKALSDVDKKLVEVNRDNSAKKQKLNAEQFIESNKSNLELLEKRVELCKEEEPVRKELEYKINSLCQSMTSFLTLKKSMSMNLS